MTEKNPWRNDSDPAQGNEPNPWASNPETVSFPPVNDGHQFAEPNPWDESQDFGTTDQSAYHDAPVATQATTQTQTKRKRGWLLPIVILLALVALVVGGGVIATQTGLINLGSDEEDPVIVTEVVAVPAEEDSAPEDDAEAEESVAAKSVEEDEEEGEEEEESRPTRVSLPGGASAANSSARSGGPHGSFDNAYTGSNVTSEAFAERVRMAYVDFHNESGRTSGTISAYSPVTQLSYTLDCDDNGSFVTCTGGNNAVVYIS